MFPEAANICHKVFGVEHHLTKTTERFAAEYSASKTNKLVQVVVNHLWRESVVYWY